MRKLKYFISDLHLSVRRGSDDFDEDKEARFAKLLDVIHREADENLAEPDDCELIILGDFLDLLESEPSVPNTTGDGIDVLVDEIVAMHRGVFGGLRAFLAQGHKLFYVVGNHDRGLCYSEALDHHLLPPSEKAGQYCPGNFMRASHYFSDALGIYADHGHFTDRFNVTANGVGDTLVRQVIRPIEDGQWDDELTDAGKKATLSGLSFMKDVPPHLADTPVLRAIDNLRPSVSALWYMWQLKDAGLLSGAGYKRFIREALAVTGLRGFFKSAVGAVLERVLQSGFTVEVLTRIAETQRDAAKAQVKHAEDMRRKMSKLWGMTVKSVVAGHTHAYNPGSPLKGGGQLYNVGAWRDTFFLKEDGTFMWYPSSNCHFGVARDSDEVTVMAVTDDGRIVDRTNEAARLSAELFGM